VGAVAASARRPTVRRRCRSRAVAHRRARGEGVLVVGGRRGGGPDDGSGAVVGSPLADRPGALSSRTRMGRERLLETLNRMWLGCPVERHRRT